MIKKRILSAILAVAMLLTFVPAFAAPNGMTFTVDSVEIEKGATEVSVPVTLSGNVGIGTAALYVEYDASAFEIKAADITVGSIFAASDYEIAVSNGVVSLSAIAFSTMENTSANGTFATMKFTVKDSAAAGKYDLTFSGDEVIGTIEEDDLTADTTLVPGSITIKEPAPQGDMTFTVDTVEVEEGATEVSVPVTLSGNVGIGTAALYVEYDTNAFSITTADITVGNIFAASDYEIAVSNGVVSLSAIAFSTMTNTSENGVFATMKFTIKDGAVAGKYDLTFSGDEVIGTIEEDDLTADTVLVPGSITIKEKPAPEKMTFTVASVEVEEGATEVVVPVTLSGNVGIGTAALYVEYDTNAFSITTADITVGSIFAASDYEIAVSDGVVSLSAIAFSTMTNTSENGVFATMKFTIKDGAAGKYDLTFSGDEVIGTIEEDDLTADTVLVPGSITLPEPVGPTYTVTALKYADGALTLEAATAITGKVLVVTYANDGKTLVDVDVVDVNVAADSATAITYSVTAGTTTKAMLWADLANCMPLADAIAW